MDRCKHCNEVIDKDMDVVCPFCGAEVSDSPTGSIIPQSVVKPAKRPKIPVTVMLGITVDGTGSSNSFQVGIPLTLKIILEKLEAKAKSVRCYLQIHRDLDYGEEPVLITNNGSPAQALEDLKSVVFTGGGDAEESHLDAVENLLTLPWEPDLSTCRGAILGILNADTKPLRSGKSIQELAQEIKKRNLLFYLVCEPTPQLQEIVNETGGMMFPISNNPEASELQKIAMQLGASIIASVSKHSTVPIVGPQPD